MVDDITGMHENEPAELQEVVPGQAITDEDLLPENSENDRVMAFVNEFVQHEPRVNTAWKSHQLPKCGAMTDFGVVVAHRPPPVPIQCLKLVLKPYKGQVSRKCTSGLKKTAHINKHHGTLRCMSATHMRSQVLTVHNAGDLPQCIGFSKAWRDRMRDLQLDVTRYVIVNPAMGEWLYGLPEGWTSANSIVQCSKALCPDRLRCLDVFSRVGGLTLATEPWFRTVAYMEKNPACQ